MISLLARAVLARDHLQAGAWMLLRPRAAASVLLDLREGLHLGGIRVCTPCSGPPSLETVVQFDGDIHTLIDPALFDGRCEAPAREALARQHKDALAAAGLAMDRVLKARRLVPYAAGLMLLAGEAGALWRSGLPSTLHQIGSLAILLLPPLLAVTARAAAAVMAAPGDPQAIAGAVDRDITYRRVSNPSVEDSSGSAGEIVMTVYPDGVVPQRIEPPVSQLTFHRRKLVLCCS